MDKHRFTPQVLAGAKRDAKGCLTALMSFILHSFSLVFWSIASVFLGYKIFSYMANHLDFSSFEGEESHFVLFMLLAVVVVVIIIIISRLFLITFISYLFDLNFVVLNLILFILFSVAFVLLSL